MTVNNEVWWDVFQRASALRERLKQAEENYEREQKRGELQAIKREAFDLLNESGIPQPLRMLIIDLWGGAQTVIDRYSWSEDKMAAALIEAKQLKPIGDKRLKTLLQEETGKSVKLNDIKNWRRSPAYKDFVAVRRETEGGNNSA